MEPVIVLTAGAIAQLAFQEFVKSGAGKVAEKSLGGAIDLVKALRDKIQAKFKGNDRGGDWFVYLSHECLVKNQTRGFV